MSLSPAFESIYLVRDNIPDLLTLPAPEHPLITGRLRPRKRKAPALPIILKHYKPIKQLARKR